MYAPGDSAPKETAVEKDGKGQWIGFIGAMAFVLVLIITQMNQ